MPKTTAFTPAITRAIVLQNRIISPVHRIVLSGNRKTFVRVEAIEETTPNTTLPMSYRCRVISEGYTENLEFDVELQFRTDRARCFALLDNGDWLAAIRYALEHLAENARSGDLDLPGYVQNRLLEVADAFAAADVAA